MANPSKSFEMIRLYPKYNSDPSEGKVGEIYYNTILQTLRLCVSSSPSWVSLGGQSTDSFQDKNVLLTEGGIWSNTHDGLGNYTLTFTENAFLSAAGLPDVSNQISPDSFILNSGQVLYVDLNRTLTPTTLVPSVSPIDTLSYNKDRLIIARCINGILLINDRLSLIEGSSAVLDSGISTLFSQNSNMNLIGGGVWSYSGLGALSWSENAHINVAGLPLAANTILSGSQTLSSGEFLFASIFRSGNSNTLTLQKSASTFTLDYFIIAYNDGSSIWLANGERLVSGESKKAGESVSIELLSSLGAQDWKDKEGQLRLLADSDPGITYLTPVNKSAIDFTKRSLSVKNYNVIFNGIKINWQTGEIFNYSGSSLITTFTLPNTQIADGSSRWYSVCLHQGTVDSDNQIELTPIITSASSDSLTIKANYIPNSIQVGQVLLLNAGGNITTSQTNIIQNTLGSSASGASGPNNSIQFNNLDALDGDSRFTWNPSTGMINLNGMEHSVLSLSLSVLDNQSVWASIISFNKNDYPFVIIEYSLVKSGKYRVGRFLITNDGVSVGFNDDYTETVFSGVNFDAQINGSNVEIIYTSSLTGNNGIFKYSVRRWS